MAPEVLQIRTRPRKNQREHRFVILGAGLTGLSAAARLDELGERDYLLVEREDRPGGWAKTDFTGDYGADRAGHVLYFREEETRRRVERLLDGRWIRHTKNCVVDSMGVRTPFPYHANLHGRPQDVVAECLRGLLDASAHHATSPPPATFLEWILHSYGPGIARHFMVPYNTKMWTVPPELMTADWMGGFVPPIDIRRALEGALLKVDSRVGLNAEFFYPEMGISALADALSSELQGEVRYNVTANKIASGEKLVSLSDGSTHSFESVISTIPLTRLARITDDLPPLVTEVAASLTAMDLVLVDIGVRHPRDEGVHWAYLPDADVLGFRLSAVHNLTDRLTPNGHGLYTVEIAHSATRPLPGSLLQGRVVADLVRLGWLRSEGDTTFIQERRYDTAYALPLLGSAQAAAATRWHLEAFDIYPVGRFAEWKYSNMEDALLDGRAAVDQLVLGSTSVVPR